MVMSIESIHQAVKLFSFIWAHPANKGKRVSALFRAALFQFRGRVLHQRALAAIGTHSRIWVDLHRTGGSKALYANPPDYPEMLVWQSWLSPGDLFVDVGANVGTYTILAGDLGSDVIALEPAPDTCALLEENVRLNGYSVKVVQAAAGSSNGVASFTSGRDCVNQIDPSGDTSVKMVRVDDLIGTRAVKGMKIDVEGFEIEVLKGCETSLMAGRIALLQLEWNHESATAVGTNRAPVAEFLNSCGYTLFRPSMSGALVRLDCVPDYGPDLFAMRPDHLTLK